MVFLPATVRQAVQSSKKYKYKQKQNKTASVMCRLPVNARECINGYKLLYGHVFCGENWWELLTGGNCFSSNV